MMMIVVLVVMRVSRVRVVTPDRDVKWVRVLSIGLTQNHILALLAEQRHRLRQSFNRSLHKLRRRLLNLLVIL